MAISGNHLKLSKVWRVFFRVDANYDTNTIDVDKHNITHKRGNK